MTESRRAVRERSMPTEVGDAVTSVGVEGMRDELRIAGTTGTTRGAVGTAGDVTGRAHATAASANNSGTGRISGSYQLSAISYRLSAARSARPAAEPLIHYPAVPS